MAFPCQCEQGTRAETAGKKTPGAKSKCANCIGQQQCRSQAFVSKNYYAKARASTSRPEWTILYSQPPPHTT